MAVDTAGASGPRWTVRPPPPPGVVRELARALSVPPLLASIMAARGLTVGATAFLRPPLELSRIPSLDAAAERLEHALQNKRRVLVHGDYDADGISGTAVLTLGLRALGGDVTPFIPDRLHDGYGVHPDRVAEHIERADLFITVDCGISNLDELARLQAAGVETIVSDHHQPGTELPAGIVVHPKLSPLAQQGLPELTGAGVAYHLLWALHERLGLEPPVDYSDLATLGTIADVAPLLGENRALIQEGLARLADSRWPGVRAMIAQSRLKGPPSARDVAFVLAPRLNAAGRLGEADVGLELLMTASERRARELAVYLDARNLERRKIQDGMFQEALLKCDDTAPALVLDDPGWHPGVMGIVASKLLERYYKPVYIIARGKGSVRSVPGVSAVAGLQHAAPHLKRFGGHSQAAGFALQDQDVAAFRSAIYDFMAQHPARERVVAADALISSTQVDDDLFRAIVTLEPYGEGHRAPLFALTDRLDAARAVGQTKTTLQLRVGGLKGVAWQKGELAEQLPSGAAVNTVISLQENEWQGKRSLEFVADDVRAARPLGFAELGPTGKFFRGRPRDEAGAEKVRTLQDLRKDAPCLWLHALPLEPDPLHATRALHRLTGAEVYFDLNGAALRDLETAAAHYPSLHDVRRGFVALKRGGCLPFEDAKADVVAGILRELDLVDVAGRVLRAQKRDPYQSETLLDGLLERYKLQTFLNAYRHLDDAAFAATVGILFKNESVAEDGTGQVSL